MDRETVARDADRAIQNFYGALLDIAEDADNIPDDARVMLPVGEVRAIIRHRNALRPEAQDGVAEDFAIADRLLAELEEYDSDLTCGSEIDNVRKALRALSQGGK